MSIPRPSKGFTAPGLAPETIIPILGEVRFNALPASAEPIDPAYWELLSWRLPEMQEHAAEKGTPFTDDAILTVASAQPDGDDWLLTPGLSTYYRWAVSSGALDQELNGHEALRLPGAGTTLRDRLALRPRGLHDVNGTLLPVKAGTGAAVITADNRLILGVRARTFVAGHTDDPRLNVHVVAEGLLPTDTGDGGTISPAAGAARGILEEYGLTEADVIPAGSFLDAQRLQPIFAHLAYVNASFDDVAASAASAHDGWEADRLVSIQFRPGAEIDALLAGNHPELVLASNHAWAFLSAAQQTAFGADLQEAA